MSRREVEREVRPGAVLAIVSAGLMLATIDLFIVNVAFPSLEQSFRGTSVSSLSWVLNAYTIVFAALLVPAGRLADRVGLKRGFLAGVSVFTIGSALCAASGGVVELVGARIVQAAGASLMIPCSLGLLLAAYPPDRRHGAVRTWAALAGLSAALGPVLGGLLLTIDWRWIFLVNLPVGIATLAFGARALPAPPPQRERLPDPLGVVALAGGAAALTLALVEAPKWGFGSPSAVGCFAGGVAALGVFVARSRTHPRPVVELSLLRVRTFAVSTLAVMLFSTSFAALLFSILVWAQTAWGWSALRTGLAFAPGPLLVPICSFAVARLAPRLGAGVVACLGSLAFGAAGLDWALALGLHANYLEGMLPGTLLSGIGVGLTLPTLTATATSSLPAERFATGSAVVNMARQFGFTLGIAIFVAVLGSPHTARCAPRRLPSRLAGGRGARARGRGRFAPPRRACPTSSEGNDACNAGDGAAEGLERRLKAGGASRPGGSVRGVHLVSVNLRSAPEVVRVGSREVGTGIGKEPVEHASLEVFGLAGDVVVDVENHGGADQAVYVYSAEDYAWWEAELGSPLLPGRFGENLTFSSFGDGPVRIGDRFRIGAEVVLEATAARIPCGVFAVQMGERDWVKRFAAARRPGFYARVLAPGKVAVGEEIERLGGGEGHPSIVTSLEVYYESAPSPEVVRALLAAPVAIRARVELEQKLAAL